MRQDARTLQVHGQGQTFSARRAVYHAHLASFCRPPIALVTATVTTFVSRASLLAFVRMVFSTTRLLLSVMEPGLTV